MIATIIACDHAERRSDCLLRMTGSFEALFAPHAQSASGRAGRPGPADAWPRAQAEGCEPQPAGARS